VNFAVQEHEGLLREIFGLGGIFYHAHANGIDTPAMQPVQLFEHGVIAILGAFDNFCFSQIIFACVRKWRRRLPRGGFRSGTRAHGETAPLWYSVRRQRLSCCIPAPGVCSSLHGVFSAT
jgi:hypothetical protein